MKTRNNNWVRFCTIMVFAIYSCITLHAQSAFHVYRKDGTVNTFFYLNLDSISYTNAASGEEENFIQEVHTRDSIYRIPVNEIDSVSFHQPETVYQPGVVRIEEKLFPYVIKQDSLTLIVDGNVPNQLLPDIGDKLVTLEMSDVLPAGFVGEVVGITKESGNYTIECQLPLLTDIFSSYYYEGSILLDNTGEGVSTRAKTDPVWPPITKEITLPDIILPINFLDVVAMDKEWASASLSNDGTFTLESQMLIHTSLRVSDGVHFHLTMTGKHTLHTDLSVAIKGTAKHKWGKEMQTPTAVAPFIYFYMDCGPFFELAGSLATQIGFTQYFNSALHYEYDQGKPSNIPSLCTFISKGLDVNKAEIVGNLSFRAGVDLEAGVSIASTEISKAGIACYAGLGLELGMNLSDAPSIASPPDTTIYEKNKGNDLLSVNALVGAALRAKCFALENSVGIECISQPLFERGLLPDFNNVKADMSKGNAGELYVMADVSRRCLGKRRVGFALYNNNELLDKAYYDTYYDGKNDLSISHIFKGLTPGKKYKVYPIVEIFGNSEMLATPGKEVKLSANVVTGASSDVTSTSAVLAGFIEGLDEKTTGGYGVSVSTEASMDNAKFIPANSHTNGHFTVNISNLTPEKTYYWRAYVKDNNSYVYGGIKTFTTPKEEVPETPTGYLGENFTLELFNIEKVPQTINTYRMRFYISGFDLKKDAMPYLECTCAPEGYTHYAQTKTASFKENGEINIVFENLYAGTNILSFGVLIKDSTNDIRYDIGTKNFHVNYRTLKNVGITYIGDEISGMRWKANYKVTYIFENNPLTTATIATYDEDFSISGLTSYYRSSKESTDTETYTIGIPENQYDIDWNNYQAKLKCGKVVFSYYERDVYGYAYGHDDIEKSTVFDYNQIPSIEIIGLGNCTAQNGILTDWGKGGFMGSSYGSHSFYCNYTGKLFLRFATFQCEHDLPTGTIKKEETNFVHTFTGEKHEEMLNTTLSMWLYQNSSYDNSLLLKATFPNGKSIRTSNSIKIKSYGRYEKWYIQP